MNKDEIMLLATALVTQQSAALMRVNGSTPADLVALLTYSAALARSLSSHSDVSAALANQAAAQATAWFESDWADSQIPRGSASGN